MEPRTTAPVHPRTELQNDAELGSSITANIPPRPKRRSLLSSKEIPAWYSEPFIYSGYRPILLSTKSCFRSLAYLHNETINIFSHLLPALAAVILICLIPWYFSARFPNAVWQDHLIFQLYLVASAICFGTSTLYHLLLCHSERYRNLWVRCDYAGIILQILGCFVSGIYVGFYCEQNLRSIYWSMVRCSSVHSTSSAFAYLVP